MTEEIDVFEMSSWERDLGAARAARAARGVEAAGDYMALTRAALEADPGRVSARPAVLRKL